MKHQYVLFLVLALVPAAPRAMAVSPLLDDSEYPGSVLVFPLFEKGLNTSGEPRSQFEISVRCAGGACPNFQDVNLKAIDLPCPLPILRGNRL